MEPLRLPFGSTFLYHSLIANIEYSGGPVSLP
jgi:hypothetical protein